MGNFGRIVVHDVRVVGMVCGVVLMVALWGKEGFQGGVLSHDGARKNLGLFGLLYVCLGDPLLLFAAIENGRPILRPFVRSLPIQLRRVVGHREEDAKNLSVSNFRWV